MWSFRRTGGRGRPVIALVGMLSVLVLTGCSDDEPEQSPTDVLAKAKTTLDGTTSVHFTLSSENVPPGGTRLVGGEGFASRPAAFKGTLSVLLGGGSVSVELISVGGTVYAKLPFATSFSRTDPKAFGLADPATLIDQRTGISRLVGEMTKASVKGEVRIDGDVATEIVGEVPGQVVEDILTSADPATPVKADIFVTKDSGQLRRAVLTGPFFEKGKDSTFTLVLDRYGEQVTISAPPGV